MAEREFFATCPFGFEAILAQELKSMKIKRVRPLKGGVAFFGGVEVGYRACLWARSASRVLMVLDRVDASSADALYAAVKAIRWEDHIAEGSTISVAARGTNNELRNTQFSALKVKDAVCDRLRAMRGSRPDVCAHRPSVPLWVSIHGNKATVSIDFAGESLHRRGYREEQVQVEAPLKEALAAALLLKAGWPRALREDAAFCDPLCGSGTLVIEAAMIAYDMAPGLLRDYWGFSGWAQFDQAVFDELLDEADERLEIALEERELSLCGFDSNSQAIDIARACAKRAGLQSRVVFEVADCAELPESLRLAGVALDGRGLIVTNPPYGIRLLKDEMDAFYESLRTGLLALPNTWKLCAITPDSSIDAALGFDSVQADVVYNGNIEATFRTYQLGKSIFSDLDIITLEGKEQSILVSSEHAEQFAARFRKMARLRRKWAKREGIHAYRIYDADLPDYSLAVDIIEACKFEALAPANAWRPTQTCLVISEYKAPKYIDEIKAKRRFSDACVIAGAIMNIPENRVFTRVRQQERGGGQYRREEREAYRVLTQETGHVFELDLQGYLDTGLFLDHRVTRQMIEQKASGKNFLNLFAYTGTVSVYAACGGAATTTTVDLSQTYLDWAKRNMVRAGFASAQHQFVKADVLEWVKQASHKPKRYDLIFVDPPTFSNSKSMGSATWDIQRDHVALLLGVKRLLNEGGEVIFSGNLRSFKLDWHSLEEAGFVIEDITEKTIPEDFERNKKIHFCFALRLK